VPAGQDIGERPSKKHKEGARIITAMVDETGPRELLTTAIGVWNGLSELHDVYLSEAQDHPDKVPIVGITEMREETMGKGPSFEPVFVTLDWVDRPAYLPATGIPFTVAAKKKEPALTATPPSRAKDPDDEIPF
jgi:hypothetical protein